jgi:hypothetical protein
LPIGILIGSAHEIVLFDILLLELNDAASRSTNRAHQHLILTTPRLERREDERKGTGTPPRHHT